MIHDIDFSFSLKVDSSNYKVGVVVQNCILIYLIILGIVDKLFKFFKKRPYLSFIKNDINNAVAYLFIAFFVIGLKGALGFFSMIACVLLSFIYYIADIANNWNPSNDIENEESD